MGSEKIKAFFDKLPFQKWVTKAGEKIPFFTKIITYANYIGSGLSVILLIGIINLAIPNGPSHTLKYLNKVNNDTTRYWANFITKNGIDAINADNKTILSVAITSNNTELVEACFKDGADPNRLDGIILRLARNTKNPEICSLCMKYGAQFVPEDLMTSEYYDSVLDDVFIPFYKKNKCTDMTNLDIPILRDISPTRVAKLSKEGFKFSYSDMVHLCTTYLETLDDDVSAQIYLDAIKNNCNHKVFLNPNFKPNSDYVHGIIFYLKSQANELYSAENCEVVLTPTSFFYTVKYIGQPLYDIYTSNPKYDGSDITDIENVNYRSYTTFSDIRYSLYATITSCIPETNYIHCYLSEVAETNDSSQIKAKLSDFYSQPNVQKQKEHFITLINFFEEQGY
mgnify:CR=1 FL=1